MPLENVSGIGLWLGVFVKTYRIMLTVVFVLFSAKGNVSGIGLWFSVFFVETYRIMLTVVFVLLQCLGEISPVLDYG